MSHESPSIFAHRPRRHEMTLRRGDKVTRLSFAPWVFGSCVAAVVGVVALSAASCVMVLMSDDIAAAFRSREAATVTAYERRIADLRRDLDRATSREMFERRAVAEQVGRMLDRQQEIDVRFERMEPLVEQARASGLVTEVPVPSGRPDMSTGGPLNAFAPSEPVGPDAFSGFDLRAAAPSRLPEGPGAEAAASRTLDGSQFEDVADRIDAIESGQVEQLSALAEMAEGRAAEAARILADAGLADHDALAGVGGPFVPVSIVDPFTNEFERLSGALADLRRIGDETQVLPLAAPVEHMRASSNFGVRLDPFLGRPAMHAGVDYPAPKGTAVRASAAGTVVKAGRSGGYGLMVEIDHGGGHVSRYAHLSSLDVSDGETVAPGTPIGRVGSTGRSTGPHLHYEVHRNGRAVNPSRYLAAGAALRDVL